MGGLGFGVWGFGVNVCVSSGFGLRIVGFGFRVSGFGLSESYSAPHPV